MHLKNNDKYAILLKFDIIVKIYYIIKAWCLPLSKPDLHIFYYKMETNQTTMNEKLNY